MEPTLEPDGAVPVFKVPGDFGKGSGDQRFGLAQIEIKESGALKGLVGKIDHGLGFDAALALAFPGLEQGLFDIDDGTPATGREEAAGNGEGAEGDLIGGKPAAEWLLLAVLLQLAVLTALAMGRR